MKASELKFDVSDEVLNLGLRGVYLVVEGLTNMEESPELESLKEETVSRILNDLTEAKIEADSVLRAFRDLHDAVKRSNRKNVASPENLLYLLLKNRRLARLNVLVDVYNLVSVRTRLALGAHDVAKVSGNIHLKMTAGNERFWPLGSAEPKPVAAGEYGYIDDANDIICRLEVRQVEKTKITLETTEAFYIVQGNAATDDQYLRSATESLVELTKRFCGGSERILYAPWQRALSSA
jgi:DNA/RNA-binding domain of Phe-tRNA-synthetase-like protein